MALLPIETWVYNAYMDAHEVSLNGPFPLAGFWTRWFARIGEALSFPIIFIFILPVVYVTSLVTESATILLVACYVCGSVIDSYIGSKIGAPLGEFAFLLKTVSIRTGEKATFKQLFRRRVFYAIQVAIFSFLLGLLAYVLYRVTGLNFIDQFRGFGLLLPQLAMLGSPYKQTLYDMASGVIVVNTSPYYHPRYPLQVLPQE